MHRQLESFGEQVLQHDLHCRTSGRPRRLGVDVVFLEENRQQRLAMRLIERKLLLGKGVGAHHDVGKLQVADAKTGRREFHGAAPVGGSVAFDGSDIESGSLREESGGEGKRDGAPEHSSQYSKSDDCRSGRTPHSHDGPRPSSRSRDLVVFQNLPLSNTMFKAVRMFLLDDMLPGSNPSALPSVNVRWIQTGQYLSWGRLLGNRSRSRG